MEKIKLLFVIGLIISLITSCLNQKPTGTNYLTGYSAMPPSQKLTDCQLSVVKKWIDKGAKND